MSVSRRISQARESIPAQVSDLQASITHQDLQDFKKNGKFSVLSSRKSTHENRNPRKPKPWEDRSWSHNTGGSTIRAKLPGISAYDRDLEYHHVATPKVMLRLERVVGTDRLRINDTKFMMNLSKKIEDEEKRIWKSRVKVRQNAESGRYRQLVIDGIMEPDQSEDMQKLRTHPIFRVNRMMKRINKLSYSTVEVATPPPITPMEPFEEQEHTGYLFGSHQNHYLKVQRPDVIAPSIARAAEEQVEEFDRAMEEISRKSLYGLTQRGSKPNEDEEENDEEEGEQIVSRSMTHKSSRTDALAEYLRRESLTQARRYLGVDEDEVKKKFELKPNPLIRAVYDEKENSDEIFDYSSDLIKSYEREQLKTDDFCTKVLRKLFN